MPALMLAGAHAKELHSPLGIALSVTATAVLGIGVAGIAINPSRFSGLEDFGTLQACGLIGLAVSATVGRVVRGQVVADFYRFCPHCRAMSRCRHCAGEVAPSPVRLPTPRPL